MAIISKGPLGHFTGKIGEIVGSNWRGIKVIRSLPKKVKRIATEKMLNQRAKFSLVIRFLKPLRDFLKLSFDDRSLLGLTSSNQVAGQILKYAVLGEIPNISLDYSKIKISKGILNTLIDFKHERAGANVNLAWNENEEAITPIPDATVRILIYFERINSFKLLNAGSRKVGKAILSLNNLAKGDKLVAWIFCSIDKTPYFSDSQFIGVFEGE